MTNGPVQHIAVEESTSIQWVKVNGYTSTFCHFFEGRHFFVTLNELIVKASSLLLTLYCTQKGQNCILNPIALRKAKIVYNFGLSECKRVKGKNVQSSRGTNSIPTELNLTKKGNKS